MDRRKAIIAVAFASLFAAPLVASLFVGLPGGFGEFPPLVTYYPDHEPFNGLWFLGFAVIGVVAILILVRPFWFGFERVRSGRIESIGSFPWWGYAGLALNAAAWVCAWNRFAWLDFMRDHTFFPIWLGYILVVDGLVYRKRGHSLLSRSPRTFATLFPASACVWWYFEFINRFMQNWWYEGVIHFTPLTYCVSATLSFSTVLPAVFETSEWLSSHAWFQHAYQRGPRLRIRPRAVTWVMIAGIVALGLLTVFVEQLFCLAWIAPLVIMACALAKAGIQTPFHSVQCGDYSRLMSLAVAALICGFFWEMWNSQSMPKWNYSVPYVTGYRLFEMPIVGYGGYLPFGPECWCMWAALRVLLPSRLAEKLRVSDVMEEIDKA